MAIRPSGYQRCSQQGGLLSLFWALDGSTANEPEVTDLTEELGVWDGKSTAALQSIY